ncbi:hypothetical protein H2203_007478 [Taxawa tesnikishii (nom. ined.)]|nr:hypothetical protein H2203_007478 [Dothideales sp. JES 119]
MSRRYIQNSLAVDSPEMRSIQDCAKKNKITVALGFSGNDRSSLYISQCTIGVSGDIQMRRRKLMPTHMERTVFGNCSGESLTNVVSTPVGNVGQLACWEHIQPLLKYHTATQREAFHVAAWPPLFPYAGEQELWSMTKEGCRNLSRTYAIESQSFVLHTTAVITEKGVDIMGTGAGALMNHPGGGSSAIFGPDGRQISEDVEETKETLIYADLKVDEILKSKAFVDVVGHYSRPDLLWLGVDKREKLHLRPGDIELRRGAAYLQLGKSTQASQDFDRVLAIKPDFEGALVQRAKIRSRNADWDGAKADYAKAGKKGGQELAELEEAQGAATLSAEAEKTGDWAGCTSHADTAILVAGASLPLRERRARCRFEKGEIMEGLSDLLHVSQTSSSTNSHMQISATSFFALNERANGLAQARKCLHSDPDSKPCSKLLKREKAIDKQLQKIQQLMEKRQYNSAIKALIPSGEDEGLLKGVQDEAKQYQEQGFIYPKAPSNLYAELIGRTCEAYVEDYYKVLDVSRDADEREIKRAYRKASKEYHPDKAAQKGVSAEEAQKKMAAINEAYEVLSDPELKARFDRGDDPNDTSQQGNPFQGSPFGFNPSGGQQFMFRQGSGGGQQFKFQHGGVKSEDINAQNDPSVARQWDDKTPMEQKFEELYKICDDLKVGLLGTYRKNIGPVARSMAIAKRSGPDFLFLANNHSQKFSDLKDSNGTCSLVFQNSSSQDWVSISGTATTSSSDPRIKEIWNRGAAAWFGDLGDGKHDGSASDPRMTLIEVKPNYISYYKAQVGALGYAKELLTSNITGGVPNTGDLRQMHEQDIQQARSKHSTMTSS